MGHAITVAMIRTATMKNGFMMNAKNTDIEKRIAQ